jgi:hypothetical protein
MWSVAEPVWVPWSVQVLPPSKLSDKDIESFRWVPTVKPVDSLIGIGTSFPSWTVAGYQVISNVPPEGLNLGLGPSGVLNNTTGEFELFVFCWAAAYRDLPLRFTFAFNDLLDGFQTFL